MTETHIKKICISGDSGVGKTSMVSRYIRGNYTNKYIPTMNMDLFSKEIRVKNNKLILQMWDIAGIDTNGILNKMYLMGTNMYIIVFDLTCKKSFDNLDNWLNLLKTDPDTYIPVIVVGTKSDIPSYEISPDDINNYVSRRDILQYFEISSKTSYNIDSMFEYIIETVTSQNASSNTLTEPLIDNNITDTKTCDCACPTGCNIL